MALQTFTPGQVLTAAQVTALQTNDFNQTVSTKTASYTLVALDKGTRVVMNSASATTITVNTSLFSAGDTLFIHNIGAGVCTITAGTATVSTAGSLALATNAGGTLYFTSAGVAIFFPTAAGSAQGLTLINTTSFSGVSSQSVNDVFSATYDTYFITCTLTGSTTNAYLQLRLRVGGVDASGSDYVWGFIATNSGGTSFTLASGASATTGNITRPSTTDNTLAINMANPFLARKTIWSGTTSWNDGSTVAPAIAVGGAHSLTTSYTGFSLIASSGTITGSVNIYGYNK